MKTEIRLLRGGVPGALLCLTALVGLLAVGCGNKAAETTDAASAPPAAAPGTPAAAPGAPTAGGRPAPGNPNPNAAVNAAAFEAARKKAEGR